MRLGLIFLGVCIIGLGFLYLEIFSFPIEKTQKNNKKITQNTAPENNMTNPQKKFFLYEIPKEKTKKIFCDPNSPKTVFQWREFLQAEAVINGGYFNTDFSPSGFVQTEKNIWGNVQSYPAFVGITPQNTIEIQEKKIWTEKKFTQAISSFPLVVKNGKANFLKETNKSARRTVVATREGKTFFIIFTSSPTLFQTAQILAEENFSMALNLDGGPSTGFSSPDTEIPSVFVPCVIAILRKR